MVKGNDQVHSNVGSVNYTSRDVSEIGEEYGLTGNYFTYPGYNQNEILISLSGSLANAVYREMSDNDATVNAGIQAFKSFYRYATWSVLPASQDPEDLRAAQFLEECLKDMRHSISSFVSEASQFLIYGFSCFEIVYKMRKGDNDDYMIASKYNDGKIGIQAISPRAPSRVLHFDWDPKNANKLLGMTILSPPTWGLLYTPVEKLLLLKTESVSDSPWGRSILRSAYRSWFMKKYMEDMRNVIIERGGAGIPMAKVPVNLLNNTTYDQNGNVTDIDYAAAQSLDSIKSMLKGLRMTREPYVIIPQQFDENKNSLFDVGFLQTSNGNILSDIDTTIRYCDTAILRTMMCDYLDVGANGVGSFALAKVKTSNFTKVVTAHLNMIESSFNQQVVSRLFKLNPSFKITKLPELKHSSVEEMPVDDIGRVLTSLSKIGVDFSTQPDIVNAVIQAAGLPSIVEAKASEESAPVEKEAMSDEQFEEKLAESSRFYQNLEKTNMELV